MKLNKNMKISDYPKIKSPFKRKEINGRYVLTPEIEEGYEWIFDEGVRAVDKLHGTNMCAYFENHELVGISNRKQIILESPKLRSDMHKHSGMFVAGIINSLEKGWLEPIETGKVFGELIAPKMNSNLHKTDRPYFVPFDYLCKNSQWNSWIENRYPKSYESISDWFKELPSLFSKRKLKKDVLAEGLVFYHPDGRRCKLRRDMYDWYTDQKKN